MSCAMSLVALGVGYLVVLQANKEKESLKFLGQGIAVLIMIGAVLCILGAAKHKMSDRDCGKSGKAPMCPIAAKQLASSQE